MTLKQVREKPRSIAFQFQENPASDYFLPHLEKEKRQTEIDLHGGRIRTLPVMAGHWPTHIYLSGTTFPSLKSPEPSLTVCLIAHQMIV
jgi:hypothetical protein